MSGEPSETDRRERKDDTERRVRSEDRNLVDLLATIRDADSGRERSILIKGIANELAKNIIVAVILTILVVVAIFEIFVGVMNWDDCPVQNLIPLWLLVSGSTSCLRYIVAIALAMKVSTIGCDKGPRRALGVGGCRICGGFQVRYLPEQIFLQNVRFDEKSRCLGDLAIIPTNYIRFFSIFCRFLCYRSVTGWSIQEFAQIRASFIKANILQKYLLGQDTKTGRVSQFRAIWEAVFSVFWLVWLILGSYWTFSVYDTVLFKQGSAAYCDHLTYVFTLFILIASYAVMAFWICGCCFALLFMLR
ncbi:hypothetical protein Y032_0230g2984 [Ancylostoma ceylanicum]|uniref:Uncharacterized protein n=1 Tax=Ancylostoma ceylanicum TaxID=53326 RepID=A0A016SFY7_9BILA|nr:hypothetical protein Y032_0230g2984 [Ancylostoma ceylanicum]